MLIGEDQPCRPTNCLVRSKIQPNGEITAMSVFPHNHLPERGGHGRAYYETRGRMIEQIRDNPLQRPMDVFYENRRE